MAHSRRRLAQALFISSLLAWVVACSGGSTGNDAPDGGGGNTGVPGGSAGGTSTGPAGSSGSAGAVAGTSGTAGQSGQGGTTTAGGATTAAGGTTSAGGTTGAAGTTGGSKTGGTTGAAGATGSGGKGGTGGNGTTGGTTGGSAGNTGSGGGDYGFSYRPVEDKQLDYLCTLKAVGASTYVYVRLDQTGTKSAGIATIPVYTPVMAKISASGVVTDLANATYDYGGGHHNDAVQFDYQGKSYKYYHSSFGFGFRACQPMDCVSIYATGATTPTTDGCTAARALPEVCVPIKADGTHDALTDTFKKCAGDSNK